ncbi:MAG: oligosaccharide flippase family protein [Bryobacter sp.]|nr:oligosaccharide flippase family protein [Bryobacter sp.]
METPPPNRFLAALGTNAASMAATQLLGLGRAMVLARLLTPNDYGIFGMVSTVMLAVQVLTNLNFTINVVRREFANEEEKLRYLNTTWTVELARQGLVSLLLLAGAWPAAQFYGTPEVFPVLALCALTPILTGLTNAGFILLRREMDFRTIALHRFWSEVLMTVLAVGVALVEPSVWALAVSQVAGTLLAALLSYGMHGYRPRMAWDKDVLRDSASFSAHLFVAGLMTYITTQFDNLVVGKYLGAATMAAYMLAYRLANLAAETTGELLSPVLFPAVSQMQRESPERVGTAFYEGFGLSLMALLAATLPLRLGAEWVLRVVYGGQWTAAAPMLEWLVFVGILRGAARLVAPFVLALGMPKVESMSKSVEAPVFIALNLWLVPQHGPWGAAVAGVVSYSIAFVWRYFSVLRVFRKERKAVLRMTVAVLMSAVVAYGGASWTLRQGAPMWAGLVVFEVAFVALGLACLPALRGRLTKSFAALRRMRVVAA